MYGADLQCRVSDFTYIYKLGDLYSLCLCVTGDVCGGDPQCRVPDAAV